MGREELNAAHLVMLPRMAVASVEDTEKGTENSCMEWRPIDYSQLRLCL